MLIWVSESVRCTSIALTALTLKIESQELLDIEDEEMVIFSFAGLGDIS
ncbi:MAG: hypothetical protein R2759_04375 [Bacteroidales bacterium]